MIDIEEIEKTNKKFFHAEKALLAKWEKYIVRCKNCKYFCEFRIPEQVNQYEGEGGFCLNNKQPIRIVCRAFKCDNFEHYFWSIQDRHNRIKEDFQWRKKIMGYMQKNEEKIKMKEQELLEIETMSDEEFVRKYIKGSLSQRRKEK